MNINIFILSNMIKIIGEVIEETTDAISVRNPAVLQEIMKSQTEMDINMVPFIAFLKGHQHVNFGKQHVLVSCFKPPQQIIDMYTTMFSSIVIPNTGNGNQLDLL